METQDSPTAGKATAFAPDSFTALLDRDFEPRSDEQRAAVEEAVRTLAQQALSNTITMSDDAYSSIEGIIGEIDKKLGEQINLILHDESFQQLESAWRGLHHLVSNTESDEMLKIRFMDISKVDLRKTLRRYKGVIWDQTLAVDHGEDSLLAGESLDNVLHLFAPSHLRSGEDDLLLRALAHDALPMLTRKEHHDLSLDSALDSHFRAQPDTPTS